MGVGGGWIAGAAYSGAAGAGEGSGAAITGVADSAIGGAGAIAGSGSAADVMDAGSSTSDMGGAASKSPSSPANTWVQSGLLQVMASATFSLPHSGHVLVATLGSDIVTSTVLDGAYRTLLPIHC